MIFRFKKSNFRLKKSEILFRFCFITGKVEFNEITIISKENHEIVIGFPLNLNYHWIKIKKKKTIAQLERWTEEKGHY